MQGGPGPACRIVCLYLVCDDLPFDPLSPALPRQRIVRGNESACCPWFDANVRYILHKARRGTLGTQRQIARLSETMLIEIVRLQMTKLGEQDAGWQIATSARCCI